MTFVPDTSPPKKTAMKLLIPCRTALFFSSLLLLAFSSCKKADTNDDNNNNNNPPTQPGGNIADAETFSGRLQFLGATKKSGNAPKGPSGSNMRTSLRDTLYLFDEVKWPIKFLHTKQQNVTGVFVQISSAGSGGLVSHHYDVPEVPNMGSDSVSVIIIGIDETDLKLPQVYDILITPHDPSGQPLAQIKRPVKLEQRNNEVNTSGSCGLYLSASQFWRWYFSMTQDGSFVNEPNTVHSPQGQDISGHCCNGNSVYPLNCPGDSTGLVGLKKLHFATYYKINQETFSFFPNNSFVRVTEEDSPVPLPGQSNFCGSGAGVVKASLKQTRYEGKWTLKPFTYTASLNADYLKNDRQTLELLTTSSTGTGFGNPGGVVHQLDCKIGSLVLVQTTFGSGKHLIKFYELSDLRVWSAMD